MEKEKIKTDPLVKPSTPARLCRNETDKIIAGIAGGLGNYLKIDPTVIRIILILLALYGGSGIIIYLLLWLILPPCSKEGKDPENLLKENAQELKERTKELVKNLKINASGENSRTIIGIFLFIIGILYLLQNFGIFTYVHLERFWPLILVFLGLSLILR